MAFLPILFVGFGSSCWVMLFTGINIFYLFCSSIPHGSLACQQCHSAVASLEVTRCLSLGFDFVSSCRNLTDLCNMVMPISVS